MDKNYLELLELLRRNRMDQYINNFTDNNITSINQLMNANISELKLKVVPNKKLRVIIIMLKDNKDLKKYTIDNLLSLPEYKHLRPY